MTMDEALKSFTTGAAYASFQEKKKGTLTPGKWADFVILDRDITQVPHNELLEAKVLATFIEGQPVFSLIPEINLP